MSVDAVRAAIHALYEEAVIPGKPEHLADFFDSEYRKRSHFYAYAYDIASLKKLFPDLLSVAVRDIVAEDAAVLSPRAVRDCAIRTS